jgi:hypothetical protein
MVGEASGPGCPRFEVQARFAFDAKASHGARFCLQRDDDRDAYCRGSALRVYSVVLGVHVSACVFASVLISTTPRHTTGGYRVVRLLPPHKILKFALLNVLLAILRNGFRYMYCSTLVCLIAPPPGKT